MRACVRACVHALTGRYNLTLADVAGEARFRDSIGVFPEFIDGYNILVLPTTGRYFQARVWACACVCALYVCACVCSCLACCVALC